MLDAWILHYKSGSGRPRPRPPLRTVSLQAELEAWWKPRSLLKRNSFFKHILSAAALIAASTNIALAESPNSYSIIPQPAKLEKNEGSFHLRSDTEIILDTAPHELGTYLFEELHP